MSVKIVRMTLEASAMLWRCSIDSSWIAWKSVGDVWVEIMVVEEESREEGGGDAGERASEEDVDEMFSTVVWRDC